MKAEILQTQSATSNGHPEANTDTSVTASAASKPSHKSETPWGIIAAVAAAVAFWVYVFYVLEVVAH